MRVAVSIGPEHGTVGPEQVKEAAKEAVQGIGFDMLVVCGFAFDPHVDEEVDALRQVDGAPHQDEPRPGDGRRTAQEDRRWQPLHGLRRAGRGNSETERRSDRRRDQGRGCLRPDDRCDPQRLNRRHRLLVHRHRLQRRELLRAPRLLHRSRQPYDKLKRALRAEIDEDAWLALYSTISRPFDPPATGKIAVKVINHYGDEVLKVYAVEDSGKWPQQSWGAS